MLEVCCFCEVFENLLYVLLVCIFVVAKRIIVHYPTYVAPIVIIELTYELEVGKTLSTLTWHRCSIKLNLHMMLNEKNIGVGRIVPAVIIHTTLHIPANIEYIVNIMQKNTTE